MYFNMSRVSLFLLLFSTFSAASGQVLLKLGAVGRVQFSEYINIEIFLGLVFYGLSTLIWIYVLSTEKLVNVYVFTALTFVLVYLAGVTILQEKLTIQAIAGIVMVIVGIYLIVKYNN